MKKILTPSHWVALITAFIMPALLVQTSFADTGINRLTPRGVSMKANAADSVNIIKPIAELKRKVTMKVLAWSPDGKYIAVTSLSIVGGIGIWDVEKQQLVTSMQKPSDAIEFSPDGRYLVAGTRPVSMWDVKTWSYIRDLVDPDDLIGSGADAQHPQSMSISSISFSPDGGTVAVSYDRPGHGITIRLFESATGKLIRRVEAEGITATGMVFSHDGKKLWGTQNYSTGERTPNGLPVTYLEEHYEIGIWDAFSGNKLNTIKDVHVMIPMAFAASADDSILATGSWTGNRQDTRNMKTGEFRTVINKDPIRLWDANTGHLLRELPVESYVFSLDFSPDGRFLVSCQGADPATQDSIWLWDVSTGKLLQKIKFPMTDYRDQHTPRCKFSPDGSKLAAAAVFDLMIYSVTR